MTGKTQSDGAVFAWTAGDVVDSEWVVDAVESGAGIRIRLRAAGGRRVLVGFRPVTPEVGSASDVGHAGRLVHRGVAIWWEPAGLPVALVKPLLRTLLLRVDAQAAGGIAEYVSRWSSPGTQEPKPWIEVVSDSVQVRMDEVLDHPTMIAELLGQLGETLDGLVGSGSRDTNLRDVEVDGRHPASHDREGVVASQTTNSMPAVCVPITSRRFAEPVVLEALVRLADVAVEKTRKPLHLDVAGPSLAACPTKLAERSRVGVGGAGAESAGVRGVSFTELAGLLELAAVARRRFRVRSHEGHPLCLFPADRAAVRVPGSGRDAARRLPKGGSFYGERCAGCVLRGDCLGVSAAYLAVCGDGELGPPASSDGAGSRLSRASGDRQWADLARLVLTGHPDERVFLGELISPDRLPAWPCVLPWTRLELAADDAYGPCCADYMTLRAEAGKGASPQDLWNGPHLQAIRQAMTRSAAPSTCRDWCPVLASGIHRPGKIIIRGGAPEVVDAQIQLVEDMLAGSLEVRTPPLEFCAAATAQCNFRCVMCPYGEDPGHPGDELPASFWKELVPWLGRIRTLDINGGEPLVSKTFRQFVETTDFSQFPQLALHLTTNGSLLTPARLARYRRLPFSSLTISVNAATSATYKTVNRGVPWTTLRRNLDELVRLRGAGDYQCCIRYSMVILKANLAEISAFADMARADGVGMRFLLPVGNRNQQTIMDQPDLVREARESLGHVLQDLLCRGLADDARDLEGTLSVLDQRLRDGDYSVL